VIAKQLFVVAVLLVGFAVVSRESKTQAAAENAPTAAKWGHVQVVSYSSGLTGFFDTTTGRLYLYGSDAKTPFMETELQKLGEPLKIVKAPPGQ